MKSRLLSAQDSGAPVCPPSCLTIPEMDATEEMLHRRLLGAFPVLNLFGLFGI